MSFRRFVDDFPPSSKAEHDYFGLLFELLIDLAPGRPA
jgi:hypothetical protein